MCLDFEMRPALRVAKGDYEMLYEALGQGRGQLIAPDFAENTRMISCLLSRLLRHCLHGLMKG